MVVSNIFYFHPDPWGNDPIWRSYFSIGLVQPPASLAGDLRICLFGFRESCMDEWYEIWMRMRMMNDMNDVTWHDMKRMNFDGETKKNTALKSDIKVIAFDGKSVVGKPPSWILPSIVMNKQHMQRRNHSRSLPAKCSCFASGWVWLAWSQSTWTCAQPRHRSTWTQLVRCLGQQLWKPSRPCKRCLLCAQSPGSTDSAYVSSLHLWNKCSTCCILSFEETGWGTRMRHDFC